MVAGAGEQACVHLFVFHFTFRLTLGAGRAALVTAGSHLEEGSTRKRGKKKKKGKKITETGGGGEGGCHPDAADGTAQHAQSRAPPCPCTERD